MLLNYFVISFIWKKTFKFCFCKISPCNSVKITFKKKSESHTHPYLYTDTLINCFMANLWVGELQACDGEHDLSGCNEGILWDLPGNVHVVGFHILHHYSHGFTRFLTRQKHKEIFHFVQSIIVCEITQKWLSICCVGPDWWRAGIWMEKKSNNIFQPFTILSATMLQWQTLSGVEVVTKGRRLKVKYF